MNVTIRASRPFYWVNTAFPFVAAWVVSGAALTWIFWVALFFFFFPYNLAMYGINDIYDYESDRVNPRKASLEGATLEQNDFRPIWRQIILWSLPFLVVLLTQGTLASRLFLAFAALAVVSYSAPPARFKEVPLLDSLNSSLHFWNPLVYGLLLTGVSLPHYWPVLLAYLLWGMASQAFGAIQDIPFDRQAGISSVGTALGARRTALLSTALYVAAGIIIAIAYPAVLGFGVASIAFLYGVNTGRFSSLSDKNAPSANRGWRIFLTLNMAMGAYLVASYLCSTGYLAVGWPFVIAAATGLAFRTYLRSR